MGAGAHTEGRELPSMLESFKSLARRTHFNPSWDPAIPVAIPQRAKQGDNQSGYRLVKSEALGPCTGGQQQQSPRAAGRTRPCSGSPPRRAPSSGSRGRSATCPKNSQKLTFSNSHWARNSLIPTEPSKKHSCRHSYWSMAKTPLWFGWSTKA